MRRSVLLKSSCVAVTVAVLLGLAPMAAPSMRQPVQILLELPERGTLRLFLEGEDICDDLTIHGPTLELTMDCPRGQIKLSGSGELRYGTHVVFFYKSAIKVANVSFPLRSVIIPLRPGSFLLKRDGTIVQDYYRPLDQ